ncbi:hypothetical protein OC835_000508 [Tilletia horrida]|nr:hypothetical protein OC835_000508 [Tilletia horrida]
MQRASLSATAAKAAVTATAAPTSWSCGAVRSTNAGIGSRSNSNRSHSQLLPHGHADGGQRSYHGVALALRALQTADVAPLMRHGVAAAHPRQAAYSSYVPPPSNPDLDPSGVDASLFEEPSTEEYEHTRESLDLLKDLLPNASEQASTSGSAYRPGDILSSLIKQNNLLRASQVLTELKNLHTDLGMPRMEYLEAAWRSMNAEDPRLCNSPVVLSWLRLAPSVRQLQLQTQLRSNPALYEGLSQEQLMRLELGPRKGVQDPVRTAANTMMQNCLALFTQRGTSRQALADLQEALTISLSRGYSGARDELAIVFLSSHLSARDSSLLQKDGTSPLHTLWLDVVRAAKIGSDIRPSDNPVDPGEVDSDLMQSLLARLRQFFNLIVRTAVLRGGSSTLDALDIIDRNEKRIAKGKGAVADDFGGLSLVTLSKVTRNLVLTQIAKSLRVGGDEDTTRRLSAAQNCYEERWGAAKSLVGSVAVATESTHSVYVASKTSDALTPAASARLRAACVAEREDIIDYLKKLVEGNDVGRGAKLELQQRKEATNHLNSKLDILHRKLCALAVAKDGTHLGLDDPKANSRRSQDGADLFIYNFLLPIRDALRPLGDTFPPVLTTAAIRSFTAARQYERALREWADTFGNDARAGISVQFLAMAMLDPAMLKEEKLKAGMAHDRVLPDGAIPTSIQEKTFIRPKLANPARNLTRPDVIQGLRIAVAACEWDADKLSRLYKLWVAQISTPVAQSSEHASGAKLIKNGPRQVKPDVNVSTEELLTIFEVFFVGFFRQRNARLTPEGPISYHTRHRMGQRAFRLTASLKKAQKAVVAERISSSQEPAWQRHALATLVTRLVRIFRDISFIGLPSPRVEMWNRLLRALAQEGEYGWEARTRPLAAAMGMVPERSAEEHLQEGGTMTLGSGSASARRKGSGKKKALSPSAPTFLDGLGTPPRANEASFEALHVGLGEVRGGLPISQYGRKETKRAPYDPNWIRRRRAEVLAWKDAFG